eukprot:5252540-Heterocapsa_arctica.AAC.1
MVVGYSGLANVASLFCCFFVCTLSAEVLWGFAEIIVFVLEQQAQSIAEICGEWRRQRIDDNNK